MLNNFNETGSLELLARYDFLDVCLLGETGTGKTYAAELIHRLSPRKDKPFVAVNCAELPQSLVESELFGHEKGAFTGALAAKTGKFEAAAGGTLFLDEIGELSHELQAKLLKVVEEKCITRVGSVVPRAVDLRIIYATHRDLSVLREDLRYRVAAHTIHLKPLRERPEDILPLARNFINDFNRKSGRKITASEDALRLLRRAEWRGNIRELRTFLEKACLDALFVAEWEKSSDEKTPAAELTAEILLSRLSQKEALSIKAQTLNEKTGAADFAAGDYRQEVKDYDRRLIKRTLKKNGRNVSRTALELGLSRYGLIKKIKRYGIVVEAC
jgi:transcriptional regulator with GAF, ATPase, and Fis domain